MSEFKTPGSPDWQNGENSGPLWDGQSNFFQDSRDDPHSAFYEDPNSMFGDLSRKKKKKAKPAQEEEKPKQKSASNDSTAKDPAQEIFGVPGPDLHQYVGAANDPEEPDADRTAAKAKDPNAAPPTTQQPKSGSPTSETGAALPGLPKTGGQELSQTLKDQFSPVVGNLDHIRVHDTPHSHAANAHIGAEGFIDGPNIHLGKNIDQNIVIPHELGHIPQKSKKIRRKASSDSWSEKQHRIRKEQEAERERQRIAAEAEKKRLAKLEADRKAAENARKDREDKDKRLASLEKIKQKALLEKYGPDYKPPVKEAVLTAVKTVPRPKTDLSAIKEKALKEKAEQKQAQLREAALSNHPGILNILKQPSFLGGAVAFGAAVMSPALSIALGAGPARRAALTNPTASGRLVNQVTTQGEHCFRGATQLVQVPQQAAEPQTPKGKGEGEPFNHGMALGQQTSQGAIALGATVMSPALSTALAAGSIQQAALATDPNGSEQLVQGAETLGKQGALGATTYQVAQGMNGAEALGRQGGLGANLLGKANPITRFQQQVKAKSQTLLNSHKQRLNREQQAYAKDPNPNSSRWQSLWQAATQTRQLQAEENKLNLRMMQLTNQGYRVPPRPAGMSEPQYAQLKTTQQAKRAAEMIDVDQQLRAAHQQQVNLRYAFPALSVVSDQALKSRDIRSVQQRIPGEFNGMRGKIDKLNGALDKDASVGVMFDAVVNQQLGYLKDGPQKQKLRQWVKAQREKRKSDENTLGLMSGLYGLGGLAALLIPGGQAAAAPLFAASGVTGLGATLSAMPDLTLMHRAAQVGQLTNKSPEQALWELTLGGAGVTLAALDVGATARGMKALSRTATELSQSGVNLSQGQWKAGLKAAQDGPGALEQFLVDLRNAPAAAKNKLRQVLKGAGHDLQPELAGGPRGNGTKAADEATGRARPLETRTNPKGSGSATTSATKTGAKLTEQLTDAQVEKLLVKHPEWEKTKDYIGRALDPKNPPPGYRYQVRNGRPELVRGSKEGPYPPLTVENGIVYLQTGKTNRLSVFSRYKKNYLDWVEQTQGKAARVAAQKRLDNGNQLHHLTPDAVVSDNPLTQELMRRSKTYTLDRGTNILDMTTMHNPKTREIVHLGSHPKFNKYVDGLLNQKAERLTGDGAIPLEQVKVEAIDKAVRQVENTLRDQIINHTLPKDILKELEGRGFSLSKGIQDPQGEEIA
jgi:A nuclease family of the HNH/ENDO VII superfamily with conserved AHH